MVLLQTILIVILVYYALKLLFKWLGPKLLQYAIKKTGERYGGTMGQTWDQNSHSAREGETTVDRKPFRRSNPSKKVGEYIDFEEID